MDSKAFDYIRRIDALKAYDKDEHKFQENLQEIESIVRCKDCKFRDDSRRIINLDGKEIRCKCDCIGEYMLEDNFCSYGERSEQ